ncbi:hypothetical protein MUK42_05964 [Musa troglodytarum]|uniref:Uncharacterized protein n=1 Tax=Musa troglodytarum TaxID=320322 RepID=A0A9E7GZZ1_9LILI|nr:hypothetical protein MUK42_05964 [Musa troglodytarum]
MVCRRRREMPKQSREPNLCMRFPLLDDKDKLRKEIYSKMPPRFPQYINPNSRDYELDNREMHFSSGLLHGSPNQATVGVRSSPVAIFPIWSLFKAIITAPYSSDRSSWSGG